MAFLLNALGLGGPSYSTRAVLQSIAHDLKLEDASTQLRLREQARQLLRKSGDLNEELLQPFISELEPIWQALFTRFNTISHDKDVLVQVHAMLFYQWWNKTCQANHLKLARMMGEL